MIRHAWTVVCEKSIIDIESNNISLDVVEQVSIKRPLAAENAKGIIYPIRMEVVTLWYRQQTDEGIKGNGQLTIMAPNNEHVATTNIEIDLIKNHRNRTRVRLDGFPIPKGTSGFFYFVVALQSDGQWIEVANVPFEIHFQTNS